MSRLYLIVLFLVSGLGYALEVELALEVGQNYIFPVGEDLDNLLEETRSDYLDVGLTGVGYLPGFNLGLTCNLVFAGLLGLEAGVFLHHAESGVRVESVSNNEELYLDIVRYWLIRIPLLISLRQEFGLLRVQFLGGAAVDLLIDAEDYVKFSEADPEIFPHQFEAATFSLCIGASLGIYWEKDVFVDVIIFYSHQFNSFDRSGVLLNDTRRHFLSVGLRPGFRF